MTFRYLSAWTAILGAQWRRDKRSIPPDAEQQLDCPSVQNLSDGYRRVDVRTAHTAARDRCFDSQPWNPWGTLIRIGSARHWRPRRLLPLPTAATSRRRR